MRRITSRCPRQKKRSMWRQSVARNRGGLAQRKAAKAGSGSAMQRADGVGSGRRSGRIHCAKRMLRNAMTQRRTRTNEPCRSMTKSRHRGGTNPGVPQSSGQTLAPKNPSTTLCRLPATARAALASGQLWQRMQACVMAATVPPWSRVLQLCGRHWSPSVNPDLSQCYARKAADSKLCACLGPRSGNQPVCGGLGQAGAGEGQEGASRH